MKKDIINKLKIIKIANIQHIIKLHLFLFLSFVCINCTEKRVVKEPGVEIVCERHNDGIISKLGMKTDSLMQGLWIDFYPSGKVKIISFYKNGMLNGPFEIYYENGNLAYKRYFINNLSQGELVDYYEDGSLKSKSFFVNDTIHGLAIRYDEEGEIEYKAEYEMGKVVKTYIENPSVLKPDIGNTSD